MNALLPSAKALVPFVSVENMMRIVWEIGVERMISEIAAYIEEDFGRWEVFDKTPRIAAHSAEGVIESLATFSARRNTSPNRCSGALRRVGAAALLPGRGGKWSD